MAGGKNDNALGHRKVQWRGQRWWVHRLVFTWLVGPIPPKRDLDHVKAWGCIWNDCCWPGHLEPVTRRENLLRGSGVAARNAAKTHCPKKHALVPGNLVVSRWLQGWRICLTCDRDKDRARRAAGKPERDARAAQRARARAERAAVAARLQAEGLTLEQIADRLGVGSSTVSLDLTRAKRAAR